MKQQYQKTKINKRYKLQNLDILTQTGVRNNKL